MSFTNLAAPARANVKAVKMSAQERKSSAVVVRLTVPVDILDAIGKPSDCYALAVGGGDQAGKLRLSKVAGGAFSPRVLKGSAIFYLGETLFAPDGAQKATPCKHEAGAGAIIVTMPAWCFVENDEA